MSRGYLTCFCDKTYPEIILELFVEESHLYIGIIFTLFHGSFVHSISSIAEASWNSENLPTSTLFILLLFLLGHLFKDSYLRRNERSFTRDWIFLSSCLFLNEFTMLIQEISYNKILNDFLKVLDFIIFKLSKIFSVLRLGHLLSL